MCDWKEEKSRSIWLKEEIGSALYNIAALG
jgi:hypothetical protein